MLRRGRPGLAGTVVRTAAVVGTANAMNDRHERKAEEHAAEMAAQQAATAAAAAPAEPAQDPMVAQLTQLKGLLDAGILTQEEFDAKKKQILGL
ncbi:MAG: SHOCT domain-containing protein [Chloroflexota bacterium]